MGRAPCCDKANVKKGPWSPEEDAKLKAYIDNYGTGGNWIALPQKIGLKRCGKSCRLRWLNYLRPNIKHGGFTEEEDNIICSLYISIGSRWSIIAAQLPGRTDNDIKNYWNTRLKKKLLGRRKQNRLSNSKEGNDQETSYNNNMQNELSSSAIERLQLHVQLQTLQNDPFSFYNNPALCPKLNPLQQKMIETLHSQYQLNQSHPNIDNLIMHQNASSAPPPSFSPLNNKEVISTDNIIGIDHQGSDMKMMMVANSGFTEQLAELEGLINSKSSGFVSMENYNSNNGNNNSNEQVLGEFDCFKEISMDGSKVENVDLAWWPNEFHDVNSTSSNSWDNSGTTNLVPEEMYQDFGTMDYSMR